MKTSNIKTVMSVATIVLFMSIEAAAQAVGNWPQWRGPNRDGKVTDVSVPKTWHKTLKEEWRVPFRFV
ncbi:MAG: hypothetical protein ABR556_12370 [Pyrinomonadaceae bacterium]